jgi:hypothetical protein
MTLLLGSFELDRTLPAQTKARFRAHDMLERYRAPRTQYFETTSRHHLLRGLQKRYGNQFPSVLGLGHKNLLE